MKRLRIYLDTSVIGGYFDDEFQVFTKQIFKKAKNNEYIIIISDITEAELLNAPEQVRNLFSSINIDYEE